MASLTIVNKRFGFSSSRAGNLDCSKGGLESFQEIGLKFGEHLLTETTPQMLTELLATSQKPPE